MQWAISAPSFRARGVRPHFWGRMDGAERIVSSILTDSRDVPLRRDIISRLQLAIIDQEQNAPVLTSRRSKQRLRMRGENQRTSRLAVRPTVRPQSRHRTNWLRRWQRPLGSWAA